MQPFTVSYIHRINVPYSDVLMYCVSFFRSIYDDMCRFLERERPVAFFNSNMLETFPFRKCLPTIITVLHMFSSQNIFLPVNFCVPRFLNICCLL